MSFATVEDLTTRWRELSETETKRAEILLEDASLYLKAYLARYNLAPDGREALLKMITCRLVQVRMSNNDEGMTQVSRTAGSFTEQYTVANPFGNFQLTSEEKSLLGIKGRGKIMQVGPYAISE